MKRIVSLLFIVVLLLAACNTPKTAQNSIKTTHDRKHKEKNEYEKYGKKFGISFDGTVNLALLKAIDKWLGVPHKMGGCTKGGVDCSCFVKNIYQEVYSIELSRTSRSMYADCKKVSKSKLKEGDLIFFMINGKTISHVGLYLKDNMFVHTSSSRGVVISNLESTYYKQRYYSGGRVSS